jgi:hypothetical protein
MTTERYKVLGAVLALKEFTVADLATFSGVKPNTVRTVLGREPELVDEIGKQETGAKGGQFTRYHIRSDAIDRLRSELHELYRQFETYVDKEKDDADQSPGEKASKYQPPLAILAAEEALIRRFPKASDRSAKVQLIEFVRTVEAKQSLQVREKPNESQVWAEHRDFHLASLRALVDLCAAELILTEKPEANSYPAPVLRDFFFSLSEWGGRLGEQEHSANLLSRCLMSPVLGMIPHPRVALARDTTLISVLQSQADPQAREWIRHLQDWSGRVREQRPAAAAESWKRRPEPHEVSPQVASNKDTAAMISQSFAPEAVPLSIGIETLGGVVTRIIPRHTKLPARRREVFSTAADHQTSVEVKLYEGERLLARDNRKLGVFHLTGIPPAPRGIPQIEVTFEINSGGKLTVAAKNLETGNRQEIALALAPELSPHEIEKLVREAEDHAAEDREQERKIAIRNRLDSSVAAAERTLREYRDTIPDELHREVQAAIEETTRLISEGNLDNADAAIQKLDSLFYRLSSSLSISPQPAAQPAASPVSAAAPAAESAETATFAESEAGSEKVRYSSRE